MKEKLLTISIAAYNVEKYILSALESLIIPDYMDKLEVFIVDDGSTDNIAKKIKPYIEKWSESIFYIKKSNGGYGSTVNWSIEHASGKYFRLLDGDDSLNKEGLKNLLKILEECQASAVVSQAVRVYPNKVEKEIFAFLDRLEDQTVLPVSQTEQFADVAVWGYTFLTDAVRAHWKELPSHSFYTDRLFVIQALLGVTTILYTKQTVYHYRVGIDEQSTSKKSIRAHYIEAMNIDRLCCKLYEECKDKGYPSIKNIKRRLSLYYASTVCMLLLLPINKSNYRQIKNYEKEIFYLSQEIYLMASDVMKRVDLLRKSKYSLYYMWPIIEYIRGGMKGE